MLNRKKIKGIFNSFAFISVATAPMYLSPSDKISDEDLALDEANRVGECLAKNSPKPGLLPHSLITLKSTIDDTNRLLELDDNNPEKIAFNKVIETNLNTLGFNVGKIDGVNDKLWDRAITKFQIFQMGMSDLEYNENPKKPKLDTLTIQLIDAYAKFAKADAKAYTVLKPSLAAQLRIAAKSTLDVSFSFLAGKSGAESSYGKRPKGVGSSAGGLLHQIKSTWLMNVARYGRNYGLGSIVDKMKIRTYKSKKTGKSVTVHYVSVSSKKYAAADFKGLSKAEAIELNKKRTASRKKDKKLHAWLEELRFDFYYSAALGAEMSARNKKSLGNLKNNVTPLYISFVFGNTKIARDFYKLRENEDRYPADDYSAAAKARGNQSIFYKIILDAEGEEQKVPKTYKESYAKLKSKASKFRPYKKAHEKEVVVGHLNNIEEITSDYRSYEIRSNFLIGLDDRTGFFPNLDKNSTKIVLGYNGTMKDIPKAFRN